MHCTVSLSSHSYCSQSRGEAHSYCSQSRGEEESFESTFYTLNEFTAMYSALSDDEEEEELTEADVIAMMAEFKIGGTVVK